MPIWGVNCIEMVENSIILRVFTEAYPDIVYAYFEQCSKAYRKPILEKKVEEKALAMLEDLTVSP